MTTPLVLITGFGPFPGCEVNPTRELAARLAQHPPHGLRVVASELPVTFQGAPQAVERAVEGLGGERPALLLGLGVQPEPTFRLERRARGLFDTERVDNDGESAAQLKLDLGPAKVTSLALETSLLALRAVTGIDARVSDDAGGYVCDRTYRALLEAGERQGVPALFLHVPPLEAVGLEDQLTAVSGWLARHADWLG